MSQQVYCFSAALTYAKSFHSCMRNTNKQIPICRDDKNEGWQKVICQPSKFASQ